MRTLKKLSALTTAEVTLTKWGANNKRFAMSKGSIPMEPEVFQALISTPAEGEEKFVQTMKSAGVEGEGLDAALASYRMQKGMRDLIPDSVMASVAKCAGYEGVAKATAKEEGKDDSMPNATSGKVDPKAKQGQGPVKKAVDLSSLDKDTRDHIESVFKSHQSMVEKSAELEKIVKSLQDERETQQYVAKAASEYSHLPMATDELGMLLKSANHVSPEFSESMEMLLGRMNETMRKSSLLSAAGSSGQSKSGGAWEKIEALADGMVKKSASSAEPVTKSQAVDIVLKTPQGEELYREYLGENQYQRGPVY